MKKKLFTPAGNLIWLAQPLASHFTELSPLLSIYKNFLPFL
jgi:hypothetical protein